MVASYMNMGNLLEIAAVSLENRFVQNELEICMENQPGVCIRNLFHIAVDSWWFISEAMKPMPFMCASSYRRFQQPSHIATP